jgi:glucose-6-phosphate 1-dehydrogenase
MKKPENHALIIFGASGDLTFRKLIPALFDLYTQDLLPRRFSVLGVGRTVLTDQLFRDRMREGVGQFAVDQPSGPEHLQKFLDLLHYLPMDPSNRDDYDMLSAKLLDLDRQYGCAGNFLYYLATPPALYPVVPEFLAKDGFLTKEGAQGWKRIIIEKPFGTDLTSARHLNAHLLKYYSEQQLYRIDHYLGKETVQNILVTRFANGIFEPLWNRNYIHHVEITTAEDIGVEGRGGYYDHSGAMRDMVQNHLLQVAGVIAMEPPTVMDSSAIRNEILKVFQSLRPFDQHALRNNIIRGQYSASTIRGKPVKGYREEEGVDRQSRTETYLAMKLFIDNWRWGGVPFYIRTGKRLPTRVSEVVIHFNPTPHKLFRENAGFSNAGNQLVLRIQPDEGILLKFGMKVPGAGFEAKTVNMDFHYEDLRNTRLPSAYERLLLDAMNGDQTLFAHGDAVEAAWQFLQPVLDDWNSANESALYGYPAGTWGPDVADDLIEGDAFTWRYPCRNLADDGIYCEL